jgi:uncharacterized protein with PhoU and TrkA domain
MTVKHFTRANSEYLIDPHANHKLGAGDRLMVRDTSDNLKEYEKLLGADLHNEDSKVDEDHPLEAPGQQQAEVIVTQGSPLFSRTLANTRFADRYQLATLALHRTGSRNRRLMSDIANVTLQIGDVLLVQGASEKVTERKKAGRILVLDGTSDLPYSKKAPIALVILFFVAGLAAESFVLAVFFGANMSYATPMAYKTNLLIMWGSLSFLVPLFFPV